MRDSKENILNLSTVQTELKSLVNSTRANQKECFKNLKEIKETLPTDYKEFSDDNKRDLDSFINNINSLTLLTKNNNLIS